MSTQGRPKCEFPLGGMRPDAGQSLRTGLRLMNPSGMQAARWTARSAKGAS
jgi:hypothetical protein